MQPRSQQVLKLSAQFRAVRRAGLPHVLDAQRVQLERLVQHARERSPFYGRLYAGVPRDRFDLRDLAPTDKRTLLDNFDEVVTDRRLRLEAVRRFIEDPANAGRPYQEEFIVTNTSGTTGERFLVVQHMREWETFFALNGLQAFPAPPKDATAARLLRASRAGFRVAIVAATTTSQFTLLSFLVVPDGLQRVYRLEPISALLPLSEMVARLNAFRPDRLHAYATVLEALAHAQLAGTLCIDPVEVSSSSEPLTARARTVIEQAFGVWVQNVYGTCETWTIAKECPGGRMHPCIEGCVVEPVDRAGNPVRAGERSHGILVTNLHNFTQPILRYHLDDSVVPLDDPCPCGAIVPSVRLIGREDDTLVVRAADGGYAALPPMQLETLMLSVSGHSMFQIRQTERDRLRVTFVPRQGTDAQGVRQAIIRAFRGYLADRGLAHVAVDVGSRPELDRCAVSGKTKQIGSAIGSPPHLTRAPVLR
jgi:phenylacetate-coenzyme A ligase PaaK-like adenylate-forming protein